MASIVAVDPGKSGGIAWSFEHEAGCAPMPDTEQELVDLLAKLFFLGPCTLYLEQVGGFAGSAQPGSAMFTFGWWASGPLWVAHCYQVRIVMIRPQKWQKELSLGNSGGDKPEWKRRLKNVAQQRFPSLKVTLKTADALLILEAARQLEK